MAVRTWELQYAMQSEVAAVLHNILVAPGQIFCFSHPNNGVIQNCGSSNLRVDLRMDLR